MSKGWKASDIVLACQIYIGATDNNIHGINQGFRNFSVDLVDRFKLISPSNCEADTYYKRGSWNTPTCDTMCSGSAKVSEDVENYIYF